MDSFANGFGADFFQCDRFVSANLKYFLQILRNDISDYFEGLLWKIMQASNAKVCTPYLTITLSEVNIYVPLDLI